MNEGPSLFDDELLPPPPAAKALNISLSWLAKARLRGDGPQYIEIGRSVRYPNRTFVSICWHEHATLQVSRECRHDPNSET